MPKGQVLYNFDVARNSPYVVVVEGVTDVPSLARALHVPEGTVADSLGRSVAALGGSDLTPTTVRALRGGLRIPPRLAAAS